MSNAEFIRICKEKVCAYTNEYMDKTDKKKITVDDDVCGFGAARHYRTTKLIKHYRSGWNVL